MRSIPRLHLISSRQHCPVERFPEVAAMAAAGGAGAVHIREPELSDDQLGDLARRTLVALRSTGCLVLVNGNVDIALDSGAHGVHLPERDADPVAARTRLPDGSLVGVSVHSEEAAVMAERGGLDYIIAGHVFETRSKPGEAGRGLAFLRRVVESVSVPVLAIGGITPENTPDVIGSGAHGVAVLSGILAATNPEQAASRFTSALEHGMGERE